MPEAGDVLGEKYRLIRMIGKGGMGRVFEAEHLDLSKRVAIKLPHDDLLEDTRALARFKQEPRTVAATGHPGIVDVYDVGTSLDGVPYVVMEYLRGESLGTLLAREKKLDVSLATSVIAQVLSAIGAAHAKKIIHRDLKPDNIFLVDSGQALPSVKILDFGTSKVLGDLTKGEKLTESGAILGTPFYMAPEQIMDEVELDHRLDIYAVGVMFYELLTGRLPFTGTNVLSLAHKVLNDEVARPTALCPKLPEGLEEIVLRALARERQHRFRSAAAMLQALMPYLDERAKGQISLPPGLRGLGDPPSPTPHETSLPSTPEDRASFDADTLPIDSAEVTGQALEKPRPKRSRGAVASLVVVALVGGLITLSVALSPPTDDSTSNRTVSDGHDASSEATAKTLPAPSRPESHAGHITADAGDEVSSPPAIDAPPEADADAADGASSQEPAVDRPQPVARPRKNRPVKHHSRPAILPSTPPSTPPREAQKNQGRSLEFTNEWRPE